MRDKQIRADINFVNELEKIKVERIKNGYDKKLKSDRRLTLGITRSEFWKKIKKQLIEKPLKEDNRGQFRIFLFIVITLVTVILLALWAFSFNLITTAITPITEPTIANATQDTFVVVNNSMTRGLRNLSWAIIVSMIIEIFGVNFLMKRKAGWFLVHVFSTIFAVIVSVPISNAYEALITGGHAFSSNLASFRIGTHIILNLPIWVTVIGLTAGVLMVIGNKRESSGLEG